MSTRVYSSNLFHHVFVHDHFLYFICKCFQPTVKSVKTKNYSKYDKVDDLNKRKEKLCRIQIFRAADLGQDELPLTLVGPTYENEDMESNYAIVPNVISNLPVLYTNGIVVAVTENHVLKMAKIRRDNDDRFDGCIVEEDYNACDDDPLEFYSYSLFDVHHRRVLRMEYDLGTRSDIKIIVEATYNNNTTYTYNNRLSGFTINNSDNHDTTLQRQVNRIMTYKTHVLFYEIEPVHQVHETYHALVVRNGNLEYCKNQEKDQPLVLSSSILLMNDFATKHELETMTFTTSMIVVSSPKTEVHTPQSMTMNTLQEDTPGPEHMLYIFILCNNGNFYHLQFDLEESVLIKYVNKKVPLINPDMFVSFDCRKIVLSSETDQKVVISKF